MNFIFKYIYKIKNNIFIKLTVNLKDIPQLELYLPRQE